MKTRLTIQDYLDFNIINEYTIKHAKILCYCEYNGCFEDMPNCDYEHAVVNSIIPCDDYLILYVGMI